MGRLQHNGHLKTPLGSVCPRRCGVPVPGRGRRSAGGGTGGRTGEAPHNLRGRWVKRGAALRHGPPPEPPGGMAGGFPTSLPKQDSSSVPMQRGGRGWAGVLWPLRGGGSPDGVKGRGQDPQSWLLPAHLHPQRRCGGGNFSSTPICSRMGGREGGEAAGGAGRCPPLPGEGEGWGFTKKDILGISGEGGEVSAD